MNRRLILFCRQWMALVALTLALGGGQLQAASQAEYRAWVAARTIFDEAKGPTWRTVADARFADFMKKYPASEYYAEAVVFRARILFDEGEYDRVIELLSAQ